jgi:hypothetical protein
MMTDLLINGTVIGFRHGLMKKKTGTSYTVRRFLVFNLQENNSNMIKLEEERGGLCCMTDSEEIHYIIFNSAV